MNDAWDELKKAKEEEYFLRQNQDALKRMQARKEEEPRKSPITGEPMEQLTMMGVVIDRCPKSGGIWLDAGELEQILEVSQGSAEGGSKESAITNFFSNLINPSK